MGKEKSVRRIILIEPLLRIARPAEGIVLQMFAGDNLSLSRMHLSLAKDVRKRAKTFYTHKFMFK